MLSQISERLAKRPIEDGEKRTVKITAKQIHHMLNSNVVPLGVLEQKILGHDLPNVAAISCQMMIETLDYVIAWRTKEGTVNTYVLPEEMGQEDLTALIVAMRMS